MKKLLLLLLFPVVAFGAQTISTPTEFLNSATLTIDTGSSFTIQSGVTIQLSGNIVHGVATPVSNTDAVNKIYADSLVAGAGVLWGGIGGTLSDQADLQSALDAKQNLLTIGNITDAGTDGLTITGGTAAIIGTGVALSQHVADTSHNGYLSSADWNIFNGKQSTLTLGNLTDAGTDGLTVTGGTGAVVGSGTSLSQHVADATHNGYLSSTDWNTFNTGLATPSALTKTDDTNVTLTLAGSPATALLNATSMTLGWTGTLAVSRGGTGASTAGAHTFFGNNTGSTAAPGFQSVKDDDLSTSDITTNNVSTSKHGFAPKGDNVTTHYLDGTGGYSPVNNGLTPPLTLTLTNATTNLTDDILILAHDTSGTPASSFGAGMRFKLQSTTTVDRDAAQVNAVWSTATDTTRTSYLDFLLVNSAASLASKARLFASGGMSLNSTTDPGAGIFNADTGYWTGGAAATSGKFLQSDGSKFAASSFKVPTTAGGSGKVWYSDGTNILASTPTFPASASATTNKIIKSDGTNWAASTETYAAPGTTGNVLTSDGTNWTSAANTATVTAPLTLTLDNATTNTVDSILTLAHTSTGIAATSFGERMLWQLESSTGATRDAGRIDVVWTTATDATRTARMELGTVSSGSFPSPVSLYVFGSGAVGIGDSADPGVAGVCNANGGFRDSSTPPSGRYLISNGTAFHSSAYTMPTTPSTAGNVIKSDGTNFVSSDVGAWTVTKVTSSDVTRTAQTLADIGGLVSATLTNNTLYEFEAVLLVTTSADTTGTEYGIHGAGTGTAATCNAIATYTTTSAAVGQETINAVDTATATPAMTTASSTGTVIIKGWFTTTSTGTATLSIQHLKVTSGTSTVKVGSILKYRKA